jgi:hypothetical protein
VVSAPIGGRCSQLRVVFESHDVRATNARAGWHVDEGAAEPMTASVVGAAKPYDGARNVEALKVICRAGLAAKVLQ